MVLRRFQWVGVAEGGAISCLARLQDKRAPRFRFVQKGTAWRQIPLLSLVFSAAEWQGHFVADVPPRTKALCASATPRRQRKPSRKVGDDRKKCHKKPRQRKVTDRFCVR